MLNESKDKVLMISSSNHKNKWIVPKGGVENDEVADFTVTALRECWEEAGVECAVVKFLGVIADKRSQDKLKRVEEEFEKNPQLRDVDDYLKVVPKSEFHFYELKILELSNEWPEDHKRDRKWCDYATAKLELIKSKRLELLEALDRSSILKN